MLWNDEADRKGQAKEEGEKFLIENKLREVYDFKGVPIMIYIRKK